MLTFQQTSALFFWTMLQGVSTSSSTESIGIQATSACWCTALAARGSWCLTQRLCPGDEGLRTSSKKNLGDFGTCRHPKSPLPTSNSKPCLLEDLWEEPWQRHGFGMTSKGLKALVPRDEGYCKMLKMSLLHEWWITGEED